MIFIFLSLFSIIIIKLIFDVIFYTYDFTKIVLVAVRSK